MCVTSSRSKSEIAQAIAQQIRIVLTPQERVRLASVRKVDPAAYEAYVRGRYFLGKERTGPAEGPWLLPGSHRRRSDLCGGVLRVGRLLNMLGYYSALPPKAAYPNADAAARKALELDSLLAEPHTSLASINFMFNWDWSSAEREFRRAIALNPNYPVAHAWYGGYLAAMGRHDEAISEGRRAQELDPLSLITNAPLRGRSTTRAAMRRRLPSRRRRSKSIPTSPGPSIGWVWHTNRNPCMAMLSPRFRTRSKIRTVSLSTSPRADTLTRWREDARRR